MNRAGHTKLGPLVQQYCVLLGQIGQGPPVVAESVCSRQAENLRAVLWPKQNSPRKSWGRSDCVTSAWCLGCRCQSTSDSNSQWEIGRASCRERAYRRARAEI